MRPLVSSIRFSNRLFGPCFAPFALKLVVFRSDFDPLAQATWPESPSRTSFAFASVTGQSQHVLKELNETTTYTFASESTIDSDPFSSTSFHSLYAFTAAAPTQTHLEAVSSSAPHALSTLRLEAAALTDATTTAPHVTPAGKESIDEELCVGFRGLGRKMDARQRRNVLPDHFPCQVCYQLWRDRACRRQRNDARPLDAGAATRKPRPFITLDVLRRPQPSNMCTTASSIGLAPSSRAGLTQSSSSSSNAAAAPSCVLLANSSLLV